MFSQAADGRLAVDDAPAEEAAEAGAGDAPAEEAAEARAGDAPAEEAADSQVSGAHDARPAEDGEE